MLVLFPLLVLAASPLWAGGAYDEGVEGIPWGCSLEKARARLGKAVERVEAKLRPHDLPYLRELGSLYWLDAGRFSRLTVTRGEGEATRGLLYCFYRDRLFCVQRHHPDGAEEWQRLYDEIRKGYGADEKSVSRGPEGLYVTRTWKAAKVHVDLDYTSRKAKARTGYVFEGIVLLVKHRPVLDEISALHRSLRQKYDWESGQEGKK